MTARLVRPRDARGSPGPASATSRPGWCAPAASCGDSRRLAARVRRRPRLVAAAVTLVRPRWPRRLLVMAPTASPRTSASLSRGPPEQAERVLASHAGVDDALVPWRCCPRRRRRPQATAAPRSSPRRRSSSARCRDRTHARRLALVDHDEVAEAAADHRRRALLERPVGRGEHEVGGEVVGDELGVGVLALADREQDVALGEDAEARRLGVDDDRGADAALAMACAAWRSVWLGPPSAPSCSCRPAPASTLSPSRPLATIAAMLPPMPSGRGTSSGVRARSDRGQSSTWHVRAYPSVPMQRPATVRLRTSLFQEAVEIVEQEYASDLSLDDIARRVASSRRQLQRAYAEIGGTTFRDHLTRVRMQQAAELLAAPRPDRARGRAPRRLPPARPVRQGVPPLPGPSPRRTSAPTAGAARRAQRDRCARPRAACLRDRGSAPPSPRRIGCRPDGLEERARGRRAHAARADWRRWWHRRRSRRPAASRSAC